MDPAHHHLLNLAALLGRQFRVDTLLTIAQASPFEAIGSQEVRYFNEAEVRTALEAASRMQLVQRERSGTSSGIHSGPNSKEGQLYTFEHALLHQTLCEEIAPHQRPRLHRQIAQALENLNQRHRRLLTRPDELAYHFTMAGSNGQRSGGRIS